jgi:hypothetical protein
MIAGHHNPHPAIAIGGIGGSGTRLVAELLQSAGVHLGDDLNAASDNLWFTLLFKRREITRASAGELDLMTELLVAGLCGGIQLSAATVGLLHDLAALDRPQHSARWLGERVASLVKAAAQPSSGRTWGWKEPNTHVVIEALWQRLPTLRYVHVVRHGVDMAYSSNQNQLALWGSHALGEEGPVTPERSLAYWCRVHRHMRMLLERNPHRMYWLDYDALCLRPESELEKLMQFVGHHAVDIPRMRSAIRPPTGPRKPTGRIATFAPADLECVRSFGYNIALHA